MVTIGINGFGRVGRCALRAAIESGISVGAVNGTASSETMVHLLKYDSSYGIWDQEVKPTSAGFTVGGQEIKLFKERDPSSIPWSEAGVDVVLECTGKFCERDAAAGHLKGGAKKVIIAAPGKGEDLTVVLGVNHESYDPEKHQIISNASCTTNCLAPVAKVLHDSFGIEHGLMTTIHAYTGDQRLLDGTHKDLRRGRSAGLSLIPTSTGAAKALAKVIPALEGKLNGFAIRVPLPTVSVVDLTVNLSKPATIEAVNQALPRLRKDRSKASWA